MSIYCLFLGASGEVQNLQLWWWTDNSKFEVLDLATGTSRETMVNSGQQNEAVKNTPIHCLSPGASGKIKNLMLRIISSQSVILTYNSMFEGLDIATGTGRGTMDWQVFDSIILLTTVDHCLSLGVSGEIQTLELRTIISQSIIFTDNSKFEGLDIASCTGRGTMNWQVFDSIILLTTVDHCLSLGASGEIQILELRIIISQSIIFTDNTKSKGLDIATGTGRGTMNWQVFDRIILLTFVDHCLSFGASGEICTLELRIII